MKPGDRVQIPTWRDEWMQGDRYGVVVRINVKDPTARVAVVKLDKSGRERRFYVADLEGV